jgi:membrane-associated phospholipid phosphatase
MKAILYDWGGLNVWLFHLINNVRSSTIDQAMLLGTALGNHALFLSYAAVIGAGIVATWYISKKQRLALNIASLPDFRAWLPLAVFILAYILDSAFLLELKPLLDFPRPPLVLPAGSLHIIGTPEFHHSLPSGHSSFAMLVVASLWPVLPKGWKVMGALFVLWVGISRVSLGAHFPADVLAGWVSSLGIVLLARWALSLLCVTKETA